MTNAQIIFNESIKLMEDGVIGSTGRMITVQDNEGNKKQFPEPEPIHTYATWKKLGFQVKKGQKAIASFTIWKHVDKKTEMEVTYTDGSKGTEEVDNSKMFLKKASFFKADQVEKIA